MDINKSGHCAYDCADTIKTSIKKLELAGLDVLKIRFIRIMGDAGGGGAVQNVYKPLNDKAP